MLAAMVEDWHGTPRIVEIDDPQPAQGCTIVAVQAAAVGHLDATVIAGALPMRPHLPHIPGVEAAGIVVASDTHPIGARVLVRGGGIGITEPGCWASLVSAPDAAVLPWPEGMDAALAATYFVPGTTAHVALHDVGGLAEGETVLITGASGAVGTLACQLALADGATVIAVASDPSRITVEAVTRIAAADLPAQQEAIAASGCSLIIDTVGGPDLAARMSFLPTGGRVAVVGYTRGVWLELPLPAWLMSNVSLLPVNTIARADAARAAAPRVEQGLRDGWLSLEVETSDMTGLPDLLHRVTSGRVRGRAAVLPPSR